MAEIGEPSWRGRITVPAHGGFFWPKDRLRPGLVKKLLDVLIIGAGVTGCAVARELSRRRLQICVLEKGPDVACGASGANSAIIHAGYDAQPGTRKAVLNVRGNRAFDALSRELDFPFRRNGSLVLAFSAGDEAKLRELLERGRRNGVPGLRLLGTDEVRAQEPHVSSRVTSALLAPTAGITCPYEYTLALAENARHNGVEFRFETGVTGIRPVPGGYAVTAGGKEYRCRVVVNAAGVYADEMHNLVSRQKLAIRPRKGEYCLFDRTAGALVTHTLFQTPTAMGKGILVARTVDGNLLAGPTAQDVPGKEDTATTQEGLATVLAGAARSVDRLPVRQVITSFSGLRAHLGEDFLISEAPDAPGFIDLTGIESPGLSASPAIAQEAARLVDARLHPEPNASFDPRRKGIPRFREMDDDARQRLIESDPAFGRVVCRCETVTEGEIVAAIRRPLGACTLDGVKRRTRAGMGRCQAGFCTPRTLAILARELGIDPTRVTKSGSGSELLAGRKGEESHG